MRFGGFEWDSGNLPKCLGHGVSLAEIEALFRGDVYIVRDSVAGGERRSRFRIGAPARYRMKSMKERPPKRRSEFI